ncbi:hypothetical protein GCM10007874_26550 [Labrys miyagiensis]|uniref:Uncharacterized protein n=1 Tax=Labrys miyagiensis TaxID=346912 RepID=A0ABQ6CH13_9HYPH|nr:hypothetical protein GCM10007874_26550 [Labrys miyagiensis]
MHENTLYPSGRSWADTGPATMAANAAAKIRLIPAFPFRRAMTDNRDNSMRKSRPVRFQ